MKMKSSNISHHLKSLISILSDNEYHSGTAIGEELGLTRSGVWKVMKQLEDLGVEIESITNKGYKLHLPLDLLNKASIKKYLQDKHGLVDKIFLFDSLPSTNNYLIENASHFYGQTIVCLAEQQTAGRGRLGREWVSPFAANIYLSLLWNFPFNISELGGLNIVIGVAVAESIKEAANIDEIELKWPNDIFYKDKKLGGILIDIIGEYNGSCSAVIGIGVNVRMPSTRSSKIQKPWTDMFAASNKHIQRNKIIGILLTKLIDSLSTFEKKGITNFIKNWNTMDYLSGKKTVVKSGANSFKGQAKGINQHGHLVLHTDSGEMALVTTGDVSVASIKK